jgi:uncharacterized membrane protein YeaQ/YmgE (transglycosylase-associated protein family)
MYVLSWIVLGTLAGWITGRLLKGNEYGPWMDVVMGIAGALTAGLLLHNGRFSGRIEIVSTTLAAVLGAVIFTVAAAFINGRRRYA